MNTDIIVKHAHDRHVLPLYIQGMSRSLRPICVTLELLNWLPTLYSTTSAKGSETRSPCTFRDENGGERIRCHSRIALNQARLRDQNDSTAVQNVWKCVGWKHFACVRILTGWTSGAIVFCKLFITRQNFDQS